MLSCLLDDRPPVRWKKYCQSTLNLGVKGVVAIIFVKYGWVLCLWPVLLATGNICAMDRLAVLISDGVTPHRDIAMAQHSTAQHRAAATA